MDKSSASISLAVLSVGAIVMVSPMGVFAADAEERSGPAASSDPKTAAQPLQEVVVTGSRIARPELERLQPTTVINSDYLDQRAYTSVIDALNELPAFGQADNSLVGGQNPFGTGQSFANFFSLGSQRTLTLVDGRRFVPGNSPSLFGATGSGGEQVDLNVIPTLLIDRVETVAVGGAPIYGSDAIAGTVNIILKHDFHGISVDAQGGTSGHGDANQARARLLAGINFADGRGNVTASLEYAKSDSLLGTQREPQTDRRYVRLVKGDPYQVITNRRLASVSVPGVPTSGDGYLNFNPDYAMTNAAGQTLAFDNGHLAPYNVGPPDTSGVFNIGGDGLDFTKFTTYLSAQHRFNGTLFGNFNVNDNMRLFAEWWYSDTFASFPASQGNYDSALFAGAGQVGGNLIVSATNPFLSAADQATIARNLAAFAASHPGLQPPATQLYPSQFYLGRLNQDVGNGGNSADQNTRRAVLGIDGSVPIFGRDFKYELSAEYGWTTSVAKAPLINFQNYQNALNAVVGSDGQIACAPGYTNSKVATRSSTCAPFNPFGNGIASAAAFNYITSDTIATSTLTQRDVVASANGPIFSLPAGEVRVALGYENRRESADFEPDQFYQQAAGFLVPITGLEGAFKTNEVFAEALVPIISPAQNIPFLHRVEFEGAFREVDHSVAGRAATWTAGLRFEPIPMLQLRGNYTRAIRSPSVTEAFLPTSQAFATASDPCDHAQIGSGPNPAVRAANCAKAGITQPFTSDIVNFTKPITSSGDPGLKNEIADSKTFGFLFRPSDRMSLSVDYVSINISNAIVTLGPTDILNACYDGQAYPNAFCGKVSRDPNGQVSLVQTGFANAGFENFNGITSELDWSFDLPSPSNSKGFGTLDVRLDHFFTNKLNQAVGDEDVSMFAGSIGNSKHRATLNLTWSKDQFQALWQTLVVGHAVWDHSLPATNAQTVGVGTWWVHNLTLGYNVGSNLKLQLVVDNVFDRQAPFPVPASPPNSTLLITNGIETYFSGILGRYFVGRVQYKF